MNTLSSSRLLETEARLAKLVRTLMKEMTYRGRCRTPWPRTIAARPYLLAALILFLIAYPTSGGSPRTGIVRPSEPSANPPTNPVSPLFDALSACQKSLPEADRWRIAGGIHHESSRYGYDPLFVLAMIEVESGCSPTARGPRGAIGLIQLKPSTARAVARKAGVEWHGAEMLTRPLLNVRLALRYLAQLEKRFDDFRVAIAAYNMGPARVARMSPMRARGARYVRKILARYEKLISDHKFKRS